MNKQISYQRPSTENTPEQNTHPQNKPTTHNTANEKTSKQIATYWQTIQQSVNTYYKPSKSQAKHTSLFSSGHKLCSNIYWNILKTY